MPAQYHLGRQAGLRSTSDVIDQIQAQLDANANNAPSIWRRWSARLPALKELAQLRYELARRDMLDVFANAPSPSIMLQ